MNESKPNVPISNHSAERPNQGQRRQKQGRRFHNYQDKNQGDGQRNRLNRIIGVTGLKTISGKVNEEYLQMLKYWSDEVKAYLEMRDDIIVGTLLDAVKLPLMAANFSTEPGGDSDQDKEAADWLMANLEAMNNQEWIRHVEDALECVDFGFSISEIVLEKRDDGRLWLRNLEPRGQETLYNWQFDEEEKDKAVTFVQTDPDSYQQIELPLAKCVHFIYRGRKGNPQGKALLRSVFRPYKFARHLEDLEAIGIERDVGGMPIAKLKDDNFEDDDIDDLKKHLRNLRQDDELFLVEPVGVDIRAYTGGNKIYDVAAVIDRKQKEILGRMFAQFLKLGMDKVGTQALVKGSQDFFTLGLEAVQSYLIQSWNQQLVPYLFRFNSWPGLTAFPKIIWEKPGKVDLGGLVTMLNTAAGAKIFTPTDLDEEHLRKVADLPELPEEEKGQPRDVEKPPVQGLFPGAAVAGVK